MDDVTIARLLAEHALGLEKWRLGTVKPKSRHFYEKRGLIYYTDEDGEEQQFDPANVTDHAIEAAEAKQFDWDVGNHGASAWGPYATMKVVTSAEEPRPAARLSLALIRALGIEEEPTDAAD